MTRTQNGKIQFGLKEWVAIGTVVITLLGQWYDLRSKHDVAMFKLDMIVETAKDHENRIRAIELKTHKFGEAN